MGVRYYVYKQLHMAGIVTDLPIHQSSEKEIHELVENVKTLMIKLLKNFNRDPPRIVTIARSAEDEYTPANQIELIQDSVTMAMKHAYQCDSTCVVMIKYRYLTRMPKCGHKWVYETPADICDCTYL